MRIWGIAVAAALLAGCAGSEARKVDAVLEAKLEPGEVLITCRESSSGTCHALFVTEATQIEAQVKQGETGSASGLSPTTRYCIDVQAPDANACRPRDLANGQTIVRYSKVAH